MKREKILLIFILSLILISGANLKKSYAAISLTDIENKASAFKNYSSKASITKNDAENNLEAVGQILVWIGGIVSVVSVVIMGIKWLTASPEQLAKVKSQTVGLLISIGVIYAAMGIWNILIKILNK